tara:strand:- start:419 stop:742 length:324 start_codon:yes stop_codon:yes gene_type:complete
MSDSKDDLKPAPKELGKTSEIKNNQDLLIDNQDLMVNNQLNQKENLKKEKISQNFHLNSLITQNISLFTKNPNYKMLAWLIVQLIIFSLFIFSVNIFKNNLIPYFNS